MPYHRREHAGAVAVSYSTGTMPAPLPPGRRYSNGNTGSSTSGVGTGSSKISSYRSSVSSSSDRPSYCSPTSSSSFNYLSTHRTDFSSEYRRSYCSPSRSVSTSRDRSETRETLGSLASTTADIFAKYSPAYYTPNKSGSSQANNSALSTSIFGGNAADAKTNSRDRDLGGISDLGSSTTLGRPPRATRRPPLTTLTANHAQSDSAPTQVTHDERNNNGSHCAEILPPNIQNSAAGVTPNTKCTPLANPSNTEQTNNNHNEESKTTDRNGGLGFTEQHRLSPGNPGPATQETATNQTPSSSAIHGDSSQSFDSIAGTASGFHVGSTVVQNGVSNRPSGTHAGDPAMPSTSRRGDSFPGNASTNSSSNGGTSPSSSTGHQNIYRGSSEPIEGSPTARPARNRLQAPRDERCGLNGLRNIGNTCFMNSVIQCLSNTRPLLEYLLNEQYLADINTTTSSMKGALIKAFSQVIQELWEVGGDHVVNTLSLKSQIQRFAPRFMGYSQQDAQEFLRYLLEGLHEDVNRVTAKPQPIHTEIPDHYSDSQKAAESWKRYLRNENSTIVDVFVGQLRSSLHCTSCGHESVTLDPFWDLSLPIPSRSGTVKLNQCLEHFTREEVLDGDEKPTCSKCQMRRKCTKSFSIQKFPKILVIHLKRFSPMERFRGKLSVLVDFPLMGLDLSAFSAPRVQGCTYNLYGVANHSGTTYSGHYTAYCKHPYSGEWHEYNDSRVSSVAARSVISSEGYVLFYEQQPHSSHL